MLFAFKYDVLYSIKYECTDRKSFFLSTKLLNNIEAGSLLYSCVYRISGLTSAKKVRMKLCATSFCVYDIKRIKQTSLWQTETKKCC